MNLLVELVVNYFLPTSFFLPTNCTDWHEDNALRKMATGSVARIGTNAMRGLFTYPVAYCLPGTSS